MSKGITPIIGIIILLLITITLAGTGYTFISGYFESTTSKTIKLVSGSQIGDEFVIQNLGTSTIQPGELTLIVNGQDATIINPKPIPPKQSASLTFNSPVIGKNLNVRVIGPTNPVSFKTSTTDPLYEGLLLWHHADSDFSDSSPNGHSGNPIGGGGVNIDATNICIGSSYSFDGTTGYINVSDGPWFTGNFSISLWVNTTASNGYNTLLDWGNFTPALYILREGTQRTINWYDDNSFPTDYNSSYINILDNNWHHIAVTRDSADNINFYFDGSPAGSVINNATGDTQLLTIGWDDYPGDYFDGDMDEIMVWGRELSSSEINRLYQRGVKAGCI